MKKGLQIFSNEMFGKLRTITDTENRVWFVGKDVALALGYKEPTKAIREHLEDYEKGGSVLDTPGGKQQVTIINESGLYSLVLSSKLPTAKAFKHWVTSVVLPQIRQTGGYIPIKEEDDELTTLAKAFMICKRTLEQRDALIEQQKPKVLFAEAVTSADDSILIRDLAKLLTQNGIEIGQNRLFDWLRFHGYIFKNETRPMQKWVEKGIFDTNITLIETHHGSLERCTTKVTGKGQHYFIDGFLSGRFTI